MFGGVQYSTGHLVAGVPGVVDIEEVDIEEVVIEEKQENMGEQRDAWYQLGDPVGWGVDSKGRGSFQHPT